MKIALRYLWRQIKLYRAVSLVGRAMKLMPSDTPEYKVMFKAMDKLVWACENHESYDQFRRRVGG